MSTTIEWSLALPCPDQRDAIVASVVDSPRPLAPTAAAHLNRCAACRSFRDSLRTQRLLVRRVIEQQEEEQRKVARQGRLRTDMSDWVDAQLKVRGEREIARVLWRLGVAVLRMDPEVARVDFTESARGRVDESPIDALASVATSMIGDKEWARGKRPVDVRRAREAIAAFDANEFVATPPDISARVDSIRVLADLAERVSLPIRASARNLRADVEWHYGDSTLVPGLLRDALHSSIDPGQRGHAIANLALWESSTGSMDDAIDLGRQVMQIHACPTTLRVNLGVWLTAMDNRREADRCFAEAVSAAGISQFRRHWPWTLLLQWLDRCMGRAHASPREVTRAVNSMWIAYHRWCGLPTDQPATHVRSRIESENWPGDQHES